MILSQHFAPEEVSGAVLMTQLATKFVSNGHDVTFVTCVPNYPYGIPFSSYKNRFIQVEIIQGVRVIRVWSFLSTRKTFWCRILNYGTFSLMIFWGAIINIKPDVMISLSPPLPLGITALFLSRLWRVPWLLKVEDLYPEAAVSAGILKNKFVINFFNWMEKFLYQQSTHIAVITKGFQRKVCLRNVPVNKVSIIPLFANPSEVKPLSKKNSLRDELFIGEEFIILYSGNLGLTSSLEDLVLSAEILKNKRIIRFLVVGEGIKKESLMKLSEDRRLDNIQFLPYQPRKRYPELLALADVCIVTLNPNAAEASLPVKTLNYLSSARPILAIAPLECELAELIRSSNSGLVVPPGDPRIIAEAIINLINTPDLGWMGENGRKYVEDNYSLEMVANQFEQCLISILDNKG